MPFAKGKGKTGGRVKGAQNKTTKLVKEVFAEVFTELQGDKKANLAAWAKENPTEFYKLSSKLIPIQIGGEPDNPVNIKHLSDDEVKKKAEEILKGYAK